MDCVNNKNVYSKHCIKCIHTSFANGVYSFSIPKSISISILHKIFHLNVCVCVRAVCNALPCYAHAMLRD